MANQTFRTAGAGEREAFVARLRALAEAHDLLTLRDWESVSVGDVARRALLPFDEGRSDRIAADGPDIQLIPNKALLIAMVLHELGTNAVKYGSLSNDVGRVELSWTLDNAEPRQLKLRWRESGGPRVATPMHKGFGSRMIERAIRGEQGTSTIDYAPGGIVCAIEMPI